MNSKIFQPLCSRISGVALLPTQAESMVATHGPLYTHGCGQKMPIILIVFSIGETPWKDLRCEGDTGPPNDITRPQGVVCVYCAFVLALLDQVQRQRCKLPKRLINATSLDSCLCLLDLITRYLLVRLCSLSTKSHNSHDSSRIHNTRDLTQSCRELQARSFSILAEVC